MGLGKLLDCWRAFFLAYYSTLSCLAYHSQLWSNHLTNFHFYFSLDLYVGLALGRWRFNLWLRHALSGYVIGQLGTAWTNIGFWRVSTLYILQPCAYRR